MKPVFIYYNNVIVDENKRFTLEFSDGDLLEFSDLANAILADSGDFSYKKNATQTTYVGESYAFKIDKINRSKYIDNIEFFDHNLKKKTCLCLFTLQ